MSRLKNRDCNKHKSAILRRTCKAKKLASGSYSKQKPKRPRRQMV